MRVTLKGVLTVVLGLAIFAGTYDRDDWKHWIDADADCQSTRTEVLIRDGEGTLGTEGCTVVTGRWTCPYSGQRFDSPRDLDIDHIVPLRAAYDSGGWRWTAEKREAYANWLPGLIAVSAASNRSKGARGPDQWLPAEMDKCEYIALWVSVKEKWGLLLRVQVARMWAECQQEGTE